jgi:hypothetical protein
MVRKKRVFFATLAGLGCGLICNCLASSGDYEIAWPITAQIISSRTLMGFAIGVSGYSLGHWLIHGAVFGALFSIPMAFSGLMAEIPGYTKSGMFLMTVLIGMIYGVLIEVVTSVVFKMKQAK